MWDGPEEVDFGAGRIFGLQLQGKVKGALKRFELPR